MRDAKYRSIVSHYEGCLARHGDNHRGVDWPDADAAATRYKVMLELIREADPTGLTLLDFGCGASHLYEFMRSSQWSGVQYVGLDLSKGFIELSRRKYPHNEYHCLDILDVDCRLPTFDYVIMNGVLTEKVDLSYKEMLAYFKRLTQAVFRHAKKGVAFNVMSKYVDWERDDLFHCPVDVAAGHVSTKLSRDFVLRHDYGLYEYAVYAYRRPTGK